jgi:hypothetical protein
MSDQQQHPAAQLTPFKPIFATRTHFTCTVCGKEFLVFSPAGVLAPPTTDTVCIGCRDAQGDKPRDL